MSDFVPAFLLLCFCTSLRSREVITPALFFALRIGLALWSPLWFHMNFSFFFYFLLDPREGSTGSDWIEKLNMGGLKCFLL